MIYLFIVSGKKNNEEINNFKILCQQNNVTLDNTGQWVCSIIGIDQKQGKLCYKLKSETKDIHLLDVSSIIKCQIVKEFNTTPQVQQGFRSLMNKVSLKLQLSNNEVVLIPLYDISLSEDPLSTLYDAMEWEKIINKQIGKS